MGGLAARGPNIPELEFDPSKLPPDVSNPGFTPYTPAGYSPEQLKYLSAITELAKMLQGQGQQLFGVGMPAYAQAIQFYRTLAGAGGRTGLQQLLAPTQEAIAAQAKGAASAIGSGYLRGGQRDQALAELERAKFAATAGLPMQARAQAVAALMSGGTQGISLGQGASGLALQGQGAALQNVTTTDLTQQQLAEQSKQFGSNLGLGYAGLGLNKYLGMENINLGYAGLEAKTREAEADRAARAREFEAAQSRWLQEFNEQMRQFNAQQQAAWKGQLGQGLGALLGIGIGAAKCCFIFLEALEGKLDPLVRKYRDEHVTPQTRRGYYRLADRLVPLMRAHPMVKLAVRVLLVSPATSYARWYYGFGGWGWVFEPLRLIWLGLFHRLGRAHPYVRSNGEVV